MMLPLPAPTCGGAGLARPVPDPVCPAAPTVVAVTALAPCAEVPSAAEALPTLVLRPADCDDGGGTCCPFLATGFDLLWSIPGVLRMEGLSARGLKICPVCGRICPLFRDSSGSWFTARAEKNPVVSELPAAC